MRKLLLFCLFALAAVAARAQKSPIQPTKGGYLITLEDVSWNKEGVEGFMADVVVSVQPDYAKAKTEDDSLKALKALYANPKKFSVATGKLRYVNETTVMLETKANLAIPTDEGVRVTILENNGKDNSGSANPPLQAMRQGAGPGGGPSCPINAYCGCRCFRAGRDNHCVRCLPRLIKL